MLYYILLYILVGILLNTFIFEVNDCYTDTMEALFTGILWPLILIAFVFSVIYVSIPQLIRSLLEKWRGYNGPTIK